MSGPFGLQQGQKLNEIPFEYQEIAPCLYLFSSLPKNHSAFNEYVLKIAPISGLAFVKANGIPLPTNSFGSSLIAKFDEFLERLKKIYGEPKKSDFLIDGSCWDEPQDWMNGLQCGERFLGAEWSKANGVDLPNNLKSVFLGVQAIETDQGNITVEYSFENEDTAEKEINALEDDAL